jgi:hypothetical protein
MMMMMMMMMMGCPTLQAARTGSTCQAHPAGEPAAPPAATCLCQHQVCCAHPSWCFHHNFLLSLLDIGFAACLHVCQLASDLQVSRHQCSAGTTRVTTCGIVVSKYLPSMQFWQAKACSGCLVSSVCCSSSTAHPVITELLPTCQVEAVWL